MNGITSLVLFRSNQTGLVCYIDREVDLLSRVYAPTPASIRRLNRALRNIRPTRSRITISGLAVNYNLARD